MKKHIDSVEKNASYGLCPTLSFTSKSAPNLHKQVSQAEPSGSKGLGLNGVRRFSSPVSEMLRSGQQNTGLRFNILVSNSACRQIPLRDTCLSQQPGIHSSGDDSLLTTPFEQEMRSGPSVVIISPLEAPLAVRRGTHIEDSKAFFKITFAATGVGQLLLFPEQLVPTTSCQVGVHHL